MSEQPAFKLVRIDGSNIKEFPITIDQLQVIVFALNRMGVEAPVVHRVEQPVDGAYFSD